MRDLNVFLANPAFAATPADVTTLIIVLVVLCVAGGLIALLRRYFHGPSDSGEEVIPQHGIPPHLVAILVAAATVTIGRRVVIRRITFINRDTVSGWAEAGRTSIQLSHNLRRTI